MRQIIIEVVWALETYKGVDDWVSVSRNVRGGRSAASAY